MWRSCIEEQCVLHVDRLVAKKTKGMRGDALVAMHGVASKLARAHLGLHDVCMQWKRNYSVESLGTDIKNNSKNQNKNRIFSVNRLLCRNEDND